VDHERSDHHDCNRAEHRFTQRLIRKELADVAADERAEHALDRSVVNASVEHVSESRTGRKGQGNGDEDGGSQPLLS